jgi:hypothetical protein
MEFVSVSTMAGGIGFEDRCFHLLINMASFTRSTNTLRKGMSHGRLEAAVAMNVALVMTVSADKPRCNVNIQIASSFTKFEGECFAAMALHAGVHVFALLFGKLHSGPVLDGVTTVAALDVATLAVQFVIRDVSDAHESVWLFVPVTHAIAREVQALIEKGP